MLTASILVRGAAALTLAFSMQSGAKVISTRDAYLKCMRAYLHDALQDKTEPAAFSEAVATACETQQRAFHDTSIAADRAMGIKAADAKENADLMVEDYVEMFREKFADHHEMGTVPPRE